MTKAELLEVINDKNNIIGTKNLLEACKNSYVNNVIFSSSCSIYGNVTGAVSENKKPNPMGYYAYTKYKGENLIKKYSFRKLIDLSVFLIKKQPAQYCGLVIIFSLL